MSYIGYNPINWNIGILEYYWNISNSFRFKGTYHRQSNKLGFITDNPIYWDMLETLQYIGKYCRQGYILTE